MNAITLLWCLFFVIVFGIDRYLDLDDEKVYDILGNLTLTDDITNFFRNSRSVDQAPTISVILNQYKRNYIEDQLQMILRQTVAVTEVYIYQNENAVDLSFLTLHQSASGQALPAIRFIHNKNHNMRYHGRFTLPLVLDTEFTLIVDDDIVMGDRFVENCLFVTRTYEAVCGGVGQLIGATGFINVFPPTSGPVEVDHLMMSWFFRTEWIHSLWREIMPTLSQAEDIAFGAALFKNAKLRSIVAWQPIEDSSLWGNTVGGGRGEDEIASFRRRSSSRLRWAAVMYWLQAGYQPLMLRCMLGSETKGKGATRTGETASFEQRLRTEGERVIVGMLNESLIPTLDELALCVMKKLDITIASPASVTQATNACYLRVAPSSLIPQRRLVTTTL
jgi:hypothetical protein